MTTIEIGKSTDDIRTLDKNFVAVKTITNARIKEPCDILYPSVIVNYDSSITKCNYVYIPEWDRYYYIDNITVSAGHTLTLNCVVDVLNSFKDEIKNLTVNVERNENADFSDISDLSVCTSNRQEVVTLKLTGSDLLLASELNPNSRHYVFIKH